MVIYIYYIIYNRPVGLLNLGSSCFMNATFQTLFNLPSLEGKLQSSVSSYNLENPFFASETHPLF